MYEDATKKVVTINHSPEPTPGTIVVIDPQSGDVVATSTTTGAAPEGGVSDGKGRIFINLEDKNAMDVIDTKTWKVVADVAALAVRWPHWDRDGPRRQPHLRRLRQDLARRRRRQRQVVAQITNGDGVDGIAWDQSQKLLYIPSGADGNVTVVHEDSPDKYTTVATVTTMKGARTISRRSEDAHSVRVHAGVWSGTDAGARITPADGTRPRPAWTDGRCVAVRDQTLGRRVDRWTGRPVHRETVQ